MLSVPEPWTTSASASLGGTDGIVTLVEGSAFCLSSRSRRDRSRPTARPDLPRHALPLGVPAAAERQRARAARRDDPDPFSGVFVLRGPPAAGRADSHLLRHAPAVRRPRHARRHRDRNFGEEAAFCSVEIAVRRRLRRPVRGEGGPGPEARRALDAATRTGGSRSRTSAARSGARRSSTSASCRASPANTSRTR